VVDHGAERHLIDFPLQIAEIDHKACVGSER
jgi:hypothetical protein